MFRTSKPISLTRLIPFTILTLLLFLFVRSLPADAIPPAAPKLGITPTPTAPPPPTPTAIPPPTPTAPPAPPAAPPPQVTVADPVITKRSEPSQALPGEEVTFTLEVTNQGQEAAVDVVVTDVIPEYLAILEATTTQGTVNVEGQTVTVAVGVVGPSFVVEIVIRTRVREDTPAPLDMENVARLTSLNGGERESSPVTVHVPGSLLSPTGGPSASWLAYVILGTGLAVLGTGLWKRKLAQRQRASLL